MNKKSTSTKRTGKSKSSAQNPQTSKSARNSAWKSAQDSTNKPDDRCDALQSMGGSILDDKAYMESTLKLIENPNEPTPVRLKALQVVQAATFLVSKFNRWRPAYMSTLRTIAEDPDMEIRQRALGILAREKDSKAQRLLVQGLKDPSKALVPPDKALQLLGYDAHSEAYPLARQMAENPPDEGARREALRFLASDTSSTGLFEKVLRDKGQAQDVRQIAASALHTLAPEKLQAHAREIAMDSSDSEEARATSMTALAHFGGESGTGGDAAMVSQAEKVEKEAGSAELKKSARQYLRKYRR